MGWKWQHSYAETLSKDFYAAAEPDLFKRVELKLWNEELAREMNLSLEDQKAAASLLSGQSVVEGIRPIAQAYAGHQYGNFTMLGDGRAILLGEHCGKEDRVWDIQLKGAGRTEFSRGGDGKATLYAMLREYLISEAMAGLGIATTRSLAIVSTGEKIFRGELKDGGILTRVAASHLRVGTFEYSRFFVGDQSVRELLNYAVARHDADLIEKKDVARDFFERVMNRQLKLIVEWMRVGFVHGVMNTDNMSISGETIDYGPCAFLNQYDPTRSYSSIDRHGRYSFGNQGKIAQWNLACLGSALLTLMDEDSERGVEWLKEKLEDFRIDFQSCWKEMMLQKIGIEGQEASVDLIDLLLSKMEEQKLDYTNTFLMLERYLEGKEKVVDIKLDSKWLETWERVIDHQSGGKLSALARMKRMNPRYIPRNHWVEQVLKEAAEQDDWEGFNSMLKVIQSPYVEQEGAEKFQAEPELKDDLKYQTYCGT